MGYLPCLGFHFTCLHSVECNFLGVTRLSTTSQVSLRQVHGAASKERSRSSGEYIQTLATRRRHVKVQQLLGLRPQAFVLHGSVAPPAAAAGQRRPAAACPSPPPAPPAQPASELKSPTSSGIIARKGQSPGSSACRLTSRRQKTQDYKATLTPRGVTSSRLRKRAIYHDHIYIINIIS